MFPQTPSSTYWRRAGHAQRNAHGRRERRGQASKHAGPREETLGKRCEEEQGELELDYDCDFDMCAFIVDHCVEVDGDFVLPSGGFILCLYRDIHYA
jgi:hypothetical protein